MSEKSDQNKATAAYLKSRGIERTTARCPTCNRIVHTGPAGSGQQMYNHIVTCSGGGKRRN